MPSTGPSSAETVAAAILTLVLQTLSSRPRLFLSLARSLARHCPTGVQAALPAALRDCAVDPPDATTTASANEASEDESVIAERLAIDAAASVDGADLGVASPPGVVETGGGGVATFGGGSANELVLRHLRKQYPAGKLAVRDLCLRIQPGECFGFLGVNGAGKSTTFAMLTGATAPTTGDAQLYGLSTLRDQAALRRVVGYCPQHDALEGLLTARETLRMYARIKQVASSRIEAEVASLSRLKLVALASRRRTHSCFIRASSALCSATSRSRCAAARRATTRAVAACSRPAPLITRSRCASRPSPGPKNSSAAATATTSARLLLRRIRVHPKRFRLQAHQAAHTLARPRG